MRIVLRCIEGVALGQTGEEIAPEDLAAPKGKGFSVQLYPYAILEEVAEDK